MTNVSLWDLELGERVVVYLVLESLLWTGYQRMVE